MSTLLVNNIKSYTGDTVTISGSNVFVQGKTTLGDGAGVDTVQVKAPFGVTGSVSISGSADVLGNLSLPGNYGILVNSSHTVISNATGNDVMFGNAIIASSFYGSTFHFGSDASGGTLTPITTHQNFTTTRAVAALQITASGIMSASRIIATRYTLPTSEGSAESNGLFTLSGSQIFSSSAFPGGANQMFPSGDFSSSLFVFQKA